MPKMMKKAVKKMDKDNSVDAASAIITNATRKASSIAKKKSPKVKGSKKGGY